MPLRRKKRPSNRSIDFSTTHQAPLRLALVKCLCPALNSTPYFGVAPLSHLPCSYYSASVHPLRQHSRLIVQKSRDCEARFPGYRYTVILISHDASASPFCQTGAFSASSTILSKLPFSSGRSKMLELSVSHGKEMIA